MGEGVVGGTASDADVQLVTDLAKGGHAGLNPIVPPAPPSRQSDISGREDLAHLDAVRFGVGFKSDDFGGDLFHGGYTVQECTVSQCRNARTVVSGLVHNREMADFADDARAFLALALEASGLKPHALAKKAGVAPTTITRPMNDPEFKFTPKPATLRKIADAAGIALPSGLAVTAPPPHVGGLLPLLGPVQAGAFLMVDESIQEEPPLVSVLIDPRYPHAKQWLREVRGESMNARGIMPGDTVLLVNYADAGISLNSGMIVEVTRSRDGGGLQEITLKEVEVTPAGLVLWPRSTNPKWRDPVRLDDDTGNDIEVKITGLLVQKITRF